MDSEQSSVVLRSPDMEGPSESEGLDLADGTGSTPLPAGNEKDDDESSLSALDVLLDVSLGPRLAPSPSGLGGASLGSLERHSSAVSDESTLAGSSLDLDAGLQGSEGSEDAVPDDLDSDMTSFLAEHEPAARRPSAVDVAELIERLDEHWAPALAPAAVTAAASPRRTRSPAAPPPLRSSHTPPLPRLVHALPPSTPASASVAAAAEVRRVRALLAEIDGLRASAAAAAAAHTLVVRALESRLERAVSRRQRLELAARA
eukprot:c42363_g1_i1.p1 GENE.c42363_g1_i1~~c42363_g1_i1.p1  ORF type:complete len:260 (+),score=30.56 c42363_g1_i1:145-924(+)